MTLEAQEAVRVSLKKLIFLAEDAPREGTNFESTDFLAARELARFGLDALKMLQAGRIKKKDDGDAGQKDLFDAAPDPWQLRKIE